MKIAIIGDVHGKIKEMYETLSSIEKELEIDIDSLIQIGDFQAIRDERDLRYFPVPQKHRSLGDFPHYFQQGRVPKKTFFIGGNHENNHWHIEHPDGKELIENLTYLGRSGVLNLGNIRFGWVSGNYSAVDFNTTGKKRKYNHFTQKDTDKVAKESGIDVLLFHDWPSVREMAESVTKISDLKTFRQAMQRNIGNAEFYKLLRDIKPRYVFAGHIHIPLELELLLDDSKVKFISLAKFNNLRSLYLLDSENLDFGLYPGDKNGN